MPTAQVPRISKAFPLSLPMNSWGMTEVSGGGAYLSGSDFVDNPTKSGFFAPVVEARVVDEGDGCCVTARARRASSSCARAS